MVLNNVTKFHKILIKTVQLREQTSFQTVIFINKGPKHMCLMDPKHIFKLMDKKPQFKAKIA